LIIRRYNCVLNIRKIRIGSVARKDSLSSTGQIWYLITEILLHLVCIPPFVEHQFNINGSIYVEYDYTKILNIDGVYLSPGQNLYDLTIADTLKSPSIAIWLYYTTSAMISFFILFRIYHIFRLYITLSYWATPKAESICRIMSTNADFSFNLRASLRSRPLFSISVTIVLILSVSGISMQFFEYYNSEMIYALDETYNPYARIMQRFSNIYNSFWLIIVTITTVGYGDLYPTTYFGRIIAILVCIAGLLILSALIAYVRNFIILNEFETRVYNEVVSQSNNSRLLKKDACSLVGKVIRYNYLRNIQKESSAKMRMNLWIDMQYKKEHFKMLRISQIKNKINVGSLVENIYDELKIGVDPLKENLQTFVKNTAMVFKNIFNFYYYNRMIIHTWYYMKVIRLGKLSFEVTYRYGIL
jgi:hypothetical protein